MLYNRSSEPPSDGVYASYHSTWMGTSLAEYGSALQFVHSGSSSTSGLEVMKDLRVALFYLFLLVYLWMTSLCPCCVEKKPDRQRQRCHSGPL